MNDIYGYIEDKLRSIVLSTTAGKDDVRQGVNKCLETLRKVPNLETFTASLDELANIFEIISLYKQNPFIDAKQHLQNVKDLLKFSKFIFENFCACENIVQNLAIHALIHSSLHISKDPVRGYSFFYIPPFSHCPSRLPCQYGFNYEYRDRILIPQVHLFFESIKYVIFTSDDEVLIRENAIWFYHEYQGFDIFTDYDSIEQAFQEKRGFVGFLNVFDCSTFLIRNKSKDLKNLLCVFHAVNEKDIKYWDIYNLFDYLKHQFRLHFILSLPQAIDESSLPLKQMDVDLLNIVVSTSKQKLPKVFERRISDPNIGRKVVVFINSIDESFITISNISSNAGITSLDPHLSLDLSDDDLISNSQSLVQSSPGNKVIVPLFSNKVSHFKLFNSTVIPNTIFVLFVVGETQVPLFDVNFIIDASTHPNPYRRLSNIHGDFNAVILMPKSNKIFDNEDQFNLSIQNFVLTQEFDGFNVSRKEVDSKMILHLFFFYLVDNYSSVFVNKSQSAIKSNVSIDSDVVTIIRCISKVFESDERMWLAKIHEYGLSAPCICSLAQLLGRKGILEFVKLSSGQHLHDNISKKFAENLEHNIANYNNDIGQGVFMGSSISLQSRPGFDSDIFPSDFYFFGSEFEVTFVHAIKQGNQAFIDAPGCSAHPFFSRLMGLVSNKKLSFKSFNDILVVDPKDLADFNKAVSSVCSVMPFVGETILVIDVVDDISLEVISLTDKYSYRAVKTSSLFIYDFDASAMNYCIGHLQDFRSNDKKIRISYIDDSLPIVLVSDTRLNITSPASRIKRNKSSSFVCNLKSLNEVSKIKIDDNNDEIMVDMVNFIPPGDVVHPSLLSFMPALEDICNFLISKEIDCFADGEHISMSYKSANKAREILRDGSYIPPFSILPLKPTASLSTVKSKASSVSPNWSVDMKRKLLIIPTDDKEQAQNVLEEYVNNEESEVFFCPSMCEPPLKSHSPIVCYDIENNTSSSKPLCLGCFEHFLLDDFDSAKGNMRYRTVPGAFTLDGYFPLGQVFYSLRSDKYIFDLIQRWLQTLIIGVLHTNPGTFFTCPDHEDVVYNAAKADNECQICHKRLCRFCGQLHEKGQICPQKKDEIPEDTDIFKTCPKCKVPVWKYDGCNRVSCTCGCHFCWKCKAAFGSMQECYNHLKAAHGGFWN